MAIKDSNKDEKILKAAAKCFAIKGFSGARVDEIAAEAGVNKATLYYRIGDKAAIYDRIFDDMLDKVLENIARHTEHHTGSSNQASDQVRGYIIAIAEICNDKPYLSPFILREVASGGSHMSAEAMKKMHQVRSVLTNILQTGIDNKEFENVNPLLVHMMIIGTLNFYSASSPIRDKMPDLQADPHLNMSLMEMAENISELILNSIKVK